jgi:hypothetical protein
MLPPEFHAQLLGPQPKPQFALGLGHGDPKNPRVALCS